MAELIGRVNNGNYVMELWDNGTKVRYNDLDFFNPSSVESMDVKITNQCNIGCAMCHENSTCDGQHGNIMNLPFFDTLLPYTEIAIGGGNPLGHPDLIPFLEYLSERKLIPNMTVHQIHFMENIDLIEELVNKKLIYGLGVSLMSATDEFIDAISKFPNAVIHVINGVVHRTQLQLLANKNMKILILGYKEFRRGKNLYDNIPDKIEERKSELYDELQVIIEDGWFDIVSFDNLAIKQLNPKRLMNDDEWDKFYMGDDGQFTMYIDLVNQEFAKSSTSTYRKPLMNDIKDMFEYVKRCD